MNHHALGLLRRLFESRQYSIDEVHSTTTDVACSDERRADFRLVGAGIDARGCAVRACALFGDFEKPRIDRRRLYTTKHVAPSPAAVRYAVIEAQKTLVDAYGDDDRRTMIVVLLYATSSTMRVPTATQTLLDEINLHVERRETLRIEPWHVEHDFVVDVLAHVDVPMHRFASIMPVDDDCRDDRADDHRLLINVEHLPLLLLDDPVARWLGACYGDVVAELRDDCDAGRSFYYRRVVDRAHTAPRLSQQYPGAIRVAVAVASATATNHW